MKARDVLADCLDIGSLDRLAPHIAERLMANQDQRVDALLAQTPEGEGVYIAPDGELWRLEPRRDPRRYRLVPIEGADRD